MRILIAADGPNITSGYGNIARNLGKQYSKKGHDVAFLSFQLLGGPVKEYETGLPIYSAYPSLNQIVMRKSINLFNPEVIIHIRDPFAHTPNYFPQAYSFQEWKGKIKLIGYIMVQSDPYPMDVGLALNNNYDIIAVPTNYSKQVLERAGTASNLIKVVKPGIDTSVFKPVKAKKEDYGVTSSKLIVSVGVHDRPHKNWISLLYAFKLLKNKFDDVQLFLNTGTGAYHIEHIITVLGLSGSVLLPAVYIKEWGIPEEQLNEIYNIADCYCILSTAEGINLPALEALATGCPLVLTEHPNHVELIGNNALYVKTSKIAPGVWSLDFLPDIEDASEKMLEAISKGRHNSSPELIKQISVERFAEDLEKLI